MYKEYEFTEQLNWILKGELNFGLAKFFPRDYCSFRGDTELGNGQFRFFMLDNGFVRKIHYVF